MMSRAKAYRFQPSIDPLEGRQLLSGGVSASLVRGVLTVQGTSATTPIQVDIRAVPRPRGGRGPLVVEVGDFGAFLASRVRKIQIEGVAGEPVLVAHHQHRRKIPVVVSGLGDVTIPGPTAALTLDGPTAPAAGSMSAMEQQVVDLTNAARAQNGLPPLQVSSSLVVAAQVHSGDMARLNVLDHTLPGVAQPTLESRAAAVGYKYSWLGENIAFNYPDAPSVVAGWMNSPGHRANILNPNFTEIGVSVAWNSLNQAYFTEEFGRPA